MILRFFDILFSVAGLILLLPILIFIGIAIKIDSRGPVIFKQYRVGQFGKEFEIWKFRSMISQYSPNTLQLTMGLTDSRITRSGYFLRKYKLDELPQLMNVFHGKMSIVGPRPEVPKYVKYYTNDEKKVLLIKPGITDWASLIYIHEDELLQKSTDLEKDYINDLMRKKLKLNALYFNNYNIKNYFKIIYYTIVSLLGFENKHLESLTLNTSPKNKNSN